MLLYKFVSEKSDGTHVVLKSCIDGNLMFSRIPELNDMSETFVSVDDEEMKSSLERIVKEGCDDREIVNLQHHVYLMSKIFPDEQNVFKSLLPRLHLLKNHSQEQLKPLVKQLPLLVQNVNKMIQKKIGIFCVSETMDSFPMWAHYANNGKGFVVEYENLDQAFNGDETCVFDEIKCVDYRSEKRSCISFSPSDLRELFFTKLDDWGYEKEYRLVKVLEDCQKVQDGNRARYFAKKKYNQFVKRIIVGWNNTPAEFNEIKDFVACYDNRISVVQAKVDYNHIKA